MPQPSAKQEISKLGHSPPPQAPEPEVSTTEEPAEEVTPKRSGLVLALLVLLLLGAIGGGAFYFTSKKLRKPSEPTAVKVTAGNSAASEENYIHTGWQKDADQLLRGYLAATDIQGKIPFILDGDRLASTIEEFYSGGAIVDSDTPHEGFSVHELSEEDRKRGIFMMIYDQPPQFDAKEFFRPLASLEAQYGGDEADLLLGTPARVGVPAMEPLRVHAFFKRTPDGLKLDWEVFVQSKYRTLQSFAEQAEAGRSAIFRVIIVEDSPNKGKVVPDILTYQMEDPAYPGDAVRVNVKADSETGRALSLINWRGTKENRPIARTATVELKWSGAAGAPKLEISRFICWEFLGLGGREAAATASTE